MSEEEEEGIDLRARFPGMKPVRKAPALSTFNGIGTAIYGARDRDPETGTYVKSYGFCFLFLPVFFLGAYRVADAEGGGWIFLGKERLSKFARGWNTLVAASLGALATFVAIDSHRSSPAYRAAEAVAAAHAQEEAGHRVEAARGYAAVLREYPGDPAGARAALDALVELGLAGSPPEEAARVLAVLPTLPGLSPAASKTLYARGEAFVEQHRETAPGAALLVFDVFAHLGPKHGAGAARERRAGERLDLLKRVVAAEPGNLGRCTELALALEAGGGLEAAVEVLAPHRDRLVGGDGGEEGARILGQGLLAGGDYEGALALLKPYTEGRLGALEEAERRFNTTGERVYGRELEKLRAGLGPPDFYNRYDRTPEAEQPALVEAHLASVLERDAGYRGAMEAYRRANAVVPVVLDLGIAQLNRAGGMADPAERQAALKEAKETFLSIQSSAGGGGEYKLFLGQVHYWLGEHAEGEALFEALLEEGGRDVATLRALASTLRLVGEPARGQVLLEEAYEKADDAATKAGIALTRSLFGHDVDDKIAWLERADTSQPEVLVNLAYTRSAKARMDGDLAGAERLLREAAAIYQQMGKSASTLNNAALVYFSLYALSGRRDDHRRGLAMMTEAVSLQPGDSILLGNAQDAHLTAAVADLAEGAFDLAALREGADTELLPYLYDDSASRARVIGRFAALEDAVTAAAYIDKTLLLAPKSAGSYHAALKFITLVRDWAKVADLDRRLSEADPDISEAVQATLAAYAGDEEAADLESLRKRIAIYENRLADPAATARPAHEAFLANTLVELKLGLVRHGVDPDPVEVLALANRARAALTCAATLHGLAAAHLYAGAVELAAGSPEFAQAAAESRRALSPVLIPLLAERGGMLAETVLANGHVREAVALQVDLAGRFPDGPSPRSWALLKNAAPEDAAAVAAAFAERPHFAQLDGISFRLNPANAPAALDLFWAARMAGDEERARAVYDAAITAGVPLPALP